MVQKLKESIWCAKNIDPKYYSSDYYDAKLNK